MGDNRLMETIRISKNSACYSYTDAEMAPISLTAALINACFRHIHDRGCNEISYDDYYRIIDNAAFLVRSYQVTAAEDIDTDPILECFNDTDIDLCYI